MGPYLSFGTLLEDKIWHICLSDTIKHKIRNNVKCLGDFMTCNTHSNIESKGSISQLWSTGL